MELRTLSGLYVITDDTLTPPHTMMHQVEQALQGGAKIVQYRDKTNTRLHVKEKALALEGLCKKYNATFVLNDEIELAIELGLSGLHVGKSDHHRVEEVRKKFSGYLGISCYGDVGLAKEMQDKGVDYVAFGSFFQSPTKPASAVVELEVLRLAKEELNIPVCAIGGINSKNVAQVMKHSPDMVCLISDIWTSEDIQAQSKIFSNLYEG